MTKQTTLETRQDSERRDFGRVLAEGKLASGLL